MAKTSRSAFVSETEVDARPVWLGAKAAAVAASVANTAVFMMIGARLVGIVSASVNHSRSGAVSLLLPTNVAQIFVVQVSGRGCE